MLRHNATFLPVAARCSPICSCAVIPRGITAHTWT